MLDAPAIAGVYRQIGMAEWVFGDGTVTPSGVTPDTQLVYTAGGFYSFVISPENRPDLPEVEWPDLSIAPEEQLRATVKDFVFLCGRFELKEGGLIEHSVDISFHPGMVGTPITRRIRLDVEGADLELSFLPTEDGSSRYVRWKRLSAS